MFRWSPNYNKDFDGIICLWYHASPWLVTSLGVFRLTCLLFGVFIASILCRQFCSCKGFWRLAYFVDHPRNGKAKEKYRSHRWELSKSVMKGRMKIKNWVLLSWYWSVNFINDKKFGHFQLGAHSFIFASWQKSWWSICSCIYFILAIVNSKIVLRELLGLINLPKARTFCICEMMEVTVICEDKNLIFANFQIMMPYYKGFVNS